MGDIMQLRQTPVIVGRFGSSQWRNLAPVDNSCVWPNAIKLFDRKHTDYYSSVIAAAAKRIRDTWQDAPCEGQSTLRKLDGDIWAINDCAIGFHRDSTAPRHRVIGVILVNDPGYMLYQNQMVWDLPVGTIFHIDGRRTHGAIERNEKRDGLFAFLAWDVPYQSSLTDLVRDLIPSLQAYADSESRVNILAR